MPDAFTFTLPAEPLIFTVGCLAALAVLRLGYLWGRYQRPPTDGCEHEWKDVESNYQHGGGYSPARRVCRKCPGVEVRTYPPHPPPPPPPPPPPRPADPAMRRNVG